MSEVTISSFVITLDIIHPSIDLSILQEFIKNNYKKDFIFLNATDFVDSNGGRSSRNDGRNEKKEKRDPSGSISRGIKSKIDSELAKLLESKKRHIAQQEKNKSKDPSKQKHKQATDSPALYDNQTEVVFCITSFPYTPHQNRKLLDSGVDIGAFIALKPINGFDSSTTEKFMRASGDKSARTIAKRQLIDGSDMDSSLNPGVFPPLRWAQLKPRSKPSTLFTAVEVGETVEELWQTLEKEIGRIIR